MQGRQTTIGRRLTALAAGAGLALLGAVAAPAGATAAPLAFAPCAEKEQAGWECATMVAPLDHTGATPGQVELRVQRLAHDGPPRAKAIVNIEGGPGGSTTARSAQTRRLLAGPTARNGYDLILLDARATGASRPQAIALGTSRHYSTADTVKDLELLRTGLGIEKLAIMGTSYSTLYAAEYARTFPAQTDRIVLDSPLGPDGPDLFAERSVANLAPVLRDICRQSACPAGMKDVAGNLGKLVRAVRRAGKRGIWGDSLYAWSPRGRLLVERSSVGIIPENVYSQFVQADENTADYAFLPMALAAAARGDYRPLVRKTFGPGPSESSTPINGDLNRITRCLDSRVPWRFEAPAGEREPAARALMDKLPTAPLRPFDASVLAMGGIWSCIQFGPSGRPDAIKGGAIPDVPGVILQGAWDLRTPPADGRALAAVWPAGTLVMAPATGHGVLRAATPCATAAIDALLAGKTVDAKACADVRPVAEPLLVGSARDVRALAGAPRAVARTAGAVVATLRDAEVFVAYAVPRGGATVQAGMLGGWIRGERRVPSPAVRAKLSDYELVEGLRLTGTLAAKGERSWTAKAKLGGSHRGAITIAKGRLTGTIDGRRLDVKLTAALAKPAVTRFG